MVNHFEGLSCFLKRWDAGEAMPGSSVVALVDGAAENINLEGSPQCCTAAIFTKWDPLFERSLERGVKELVVRLIQRLDCVTYSSCQGHRGIDGKTGLRMREVGIVPRNREECNCLMRLLGAIADETNTVCSDLPVRVVLREGLITADGPSMPCIDIIFYSISGDEDEYFRNIEPVYDHFLKQLSSISV